MNHRRGTDSSPLSAPHVSSQVWNTDPMGICLVFPGLQIVSRSTLVFYLFFLVSLSVLYEYTRLSLLSFDRTLRASLRGAGANSNLAPASASAYAHRHPSPTPGSRRPSSTPFSDSGNLDEALLLGGVRSSRTFGLVRLPWSIQTRRSMWYTLNIALSFYIMLIIMSYNAVLIAAVLFGAFLGHFVFQRHFDLGVVEDDGKTLSCH
ncbi:BQ2448_7347 [Microbotryum intermedium]|uniref:Copper transport protein n=1 Tax=Microbotryum intermedium TaxID=269621 RepID=A0A238FMP2_9BASI|nr:BQ2448_7347 [Microbotryum intermedium]